MCLYMNVTNNNVCAFASVSLEKKKSQAWGRVSLFWDTRKASRFLNHERRGGAALRMPRSTLTSARPRVNQNELAAKLRSSLHSTEKVTDVHCLADCTTESTTLFCELRELVLGGLCKPLTGSDAGADAMSFLFPVFEIKKLQSGEFFYCTDAAYDSVCNDFRGSRNYFVLHRVNEPTDGRLGRLMF
ncbi:hypothetical protein EVAR_33862_1 [Eumeta japonica]|uniref:Uncharacterized protein n=1 Tax=Eumeta variegata TaxID=151549 RepID=A0A4C1X6J4_EUMVA|nr:hypothetical protein EVAR_33862_1 [Eumeta japonica]